MTHIAEQWNNIDNVCPDNILITITTQCTSAIIVISPINSIIIIKILTALVSLAPTQPLSCNNEVSTKLFISTGEPDRRHFKLNFMIITMSLTIMSLIIKWCLTFGHLVS